MSAERTNAGPIRTGVRVAYPPTGCPTRRPSPARWCSYAYCRSLHITSFRSARTVPERRGERKRGDARRVAPSGGSRRPTARSPAAEQLERPVERRVLAGSQLRRDARPATSGSSPTSWIQRLLGVSQRAIVRRNAPPSPVSSCHCWTVPLPNDVWPTSVARPCPAARRPRSRWPTRCRRRSGRRSRMSGLVATPPGCASVETCVPAASCSQNTGPEAMNWLATARAAVT